MKRFLASALILSAVSGFGLVGCSETSKEEVQSTTQTPGGGKTVETTTHEVKKTGDAKDNATTTGTTTDTTKTTP